MVLGGLPLGVVLCDPHIARRHEGGVQDSGACNCTPLRMHVGAVGLGQAGAVSGAIAVRGARCR